MIPQKWKILQLIINISCPEARGANTKWMWQLSNTRGEVTRTIAVRGIDIPQTMGVSDADNDLQAQEHMGDSKLCLWCPDYIEELTVRHRARKWWSSHCHELGSIVNPILLSKSKRPRLWVNQQTEWLQPVRKRWETSLQSVVLFCHFFPPRPTERRGGAENDRTIVFTKRGVGWYEMRECCSRCMSDK